MSQSDVSDLALLTLQAASEIDSRLSGLSAHTNVFRELGKQLSCLSGSIEMPATAFLQSDPMVTEIFAKAVEDSSNKRIEDISMLSDSMKAIVGDLNANDDQIGETELVQLKNFCLALHRTLSAASIPLQDWESHFDNEATFY